MKWRPKGKRIVDFELLHTLLLAVKNNPDEGIRARSLDSAINIIDRFRKEEK